MTKCLFCGYEIYENYFYCVGCGNISVIAAGIEINIREKSRNKIYKNLRNCITVTNNSSSELCILDAASENLCDVHVDVSNESNALQPATECDLCISFSESKTNGNCDVEILTTHGSVRVPCEVKTYSDVVLKYRDKLLENGSVVYADSAAPFIDISIVNDSEFAARTHQFSSEADIQVLFNDDRIRVEFISEHIREAELYIEIDFEYLGLFSCNLNIIRYPEPKLSFKNKLSLINENMVICREICCDPLFLEVYNATEFSNEQDTDIILKKAYTDRDYIYPVNEYAIDGFCLSSRTQNSIPIYFNIDYDKLRQKIACVDEVYNDVFCITFEYSYGFTGERHEKDIKTAIEFAMPRETIFPCVIDIGTTNSCMAYIPDYGEGSSNPKLTKFKKNENYHYFVPTKIFFKSFANDEHSYGIDAEMSRLSRAYDGDNFAVNFKQFVGDEKKRKYYDSERVLQEFACSDLYKMYGKWLSMHFDVAAPAVCITYPITFLPHQLKTLKSIANDLFKNAEVLAEISEPEALAVAYTQKPHIYNENFVIVDIGGGTTDMSVCSLVNEANGTKKLVIEASCGHPMIAGEYFTYSIIEQVYKNYIQKHEGIHTTFPSYKQMSGNEIYDQELETLITDMRIICETLKHNLDFYLQKANDSNSNLLEGILSTLNNEYSISTNEMLECFQNPARIILETLNDTLYRVRISKIKALVGDDIVGFIHSSMGRMYFDILSSEGHILQRGSLDSELNLIENVAEYIELASSETPITLSCVYTDNKSILDFDTGYPTSLIFALDNVILCGNGAKIPLIVPEIQKNIQASNIFYLSSVYEDILNSEGAGDQLEMSEMANSMLKAGVAFGASLFYQGMCGFDLEESRKLPMDIGFEYKSMYHIVYEKFTRLSDIEEKEFFVKNTPRITLSGKTWSKDKTLSVLALRDYLVKIGSVNIPPAHIYKGVVIIISYKNDDFVYTITDKNKEHVLIEESFFHQHYNGESQ